MRCTRSTVLTCITSKGTWSDRSTRSTRWVAASVRRVSTDRNAPEAGERSFDVLPPTYFQTFSMPLRAYLFSWTSSANSLALALCRLCLRITFSAKSASSMTLYCRFSSRRCNKDLSSSWYFDLRVLYSSWAITRSTNSTMKKKWEYPKSYWRLVIA